MATHITIKGMASAEEARRYMDAIAPDAHSRNRERYIDPVGLGLYSITGIAEIPPMHDHRDNRVSIQATFTHADFARFPHDDPHGPYREWLTLLRDELLAQEEERQRAGWLTCEGEHDRATNPRYALYVAAWELTQLEWCKRHERRAMFAAIAQSAA